MLTVPDGGGDRRHLTARATATAKRQLGDAIRGHRSLQEDDDDGDAPPPVCASSCIVEYNFVPDDPSIITRGCEWFEGFYNCVARDCTPEERTGFMRCVCSSFLLHFQGN